MTESAKKPRISPEVLEYYDRGLEAGRLTQGLGELEKLRMQDLLSRYLPPPLAVILDVDGGPGAHACWLARQGYEVHLIDPVPLHVEQALEASRQQPTHPIARASVGDARRLDRADSTADAVLLFGPLYHLIERQDRVTALREARRVVRMGGRVLAAGINRFSSLLDGLHRGFLFDPEFARIVQQGLSNGQHRNPTDNPEYFTAAFFHHPEELRAEVEEAGLRYERTLAVEGLVWASPDFDKHWTVPERRERILDAVRWLEDEPCLLGASPT